MHINKQLYLITYFTKRTLNLKDLLPRLNVKVQLLNSPKRKGHSLFDSKFKCALNGGESFFGSLSTLLYTSDLTEWHNRWIYPVLRRSNLLSTPTLNLGIALVTHFFLFFASFRRSTSALSGCHLLCEATCSLRTEKQLGGNVTAKKIVAQ